MHNISQNNIDIYYKMDEWMKSITEINQTYQCFEVEMA